MTYHNAAALLVDPATAVVDRTALTRAFEIVNAVVETRVTVPVLANARLIGDGGTMFVTGTDDDIELTVAVPAAADSRFALTLPAGKMRDLLKKATASDFVAFTAPDVVTKKRMARGEWNAETREYEMIETGETYEECDDPAVVDFERVKYRLQAIPATDFPDLSGPSKLRHDLGTVDPSYRRFSMSGAAFWQAIDGTMAAVSTEETRYYLNGIFMHHFENGNELRFVATDGHRLYRQDLAAPEGSSGMPGIIIPHKTVALLHKLMKGKACPANVDIEVNDVRIRVMWEDITLTSKVIDGRFLDYMRVTPSFSYSDPTTFRFDPAAMLEAIRAVSLISSERGRAVKLSIEPDSIGIDVNNPDMGSAHADIVADYAGPEGFEIGYNATYLSDVIGTASPDGATVTWQGTGRGDPAIFTGSRPGWLAVLMPVRV